MTTIKPATAKSSTAAANIDQDSLGLKELAQGVLDRDFRPRIASVRRLAQAILDAEQKASAAEVPGEKGRSKKSKKSKPAAAAKGKKKGGGKKRKLAKIPGQQGK